MATAPDGAAGTGELQSLIGQQFFWVWASCHNGDLIELSNSVPIFFVVASDIAVQYPKFYGYSYLTFEPLRNSYQKFQITIEFKADVDDGLLLYCGERENGHGDFLSLAIIRRRLQFRFNCGTGAASLVSESRVQTGHWHIATIYRNGINGWLRLDNDTPVTGKSK
eukprot:g36305.t1